MTYNDSYSSFPVFYLLWTRDGNSLSVSSIPDTLVQISRNRKRKHSSKEGDVTDTYYIGQVTKSVERIKTHGGVGNSDDYTLFRLLTEDNYVPL